MSDETESKAAFGRRIGVSGQRVGQLAQRGYIVTTDRGRVRVEASLKMLRDAGKLPAEAEPAETGGADPVATAATYAETERQVGAIIALQAAQARWPAFAAIAAAEHGVSVEAARSILSTFAVAATEDAADFLAQAGVTAFQEGDPAVWRTDTTEPVWPELEKLARGESE